MMDMIKIGSYLLAFVGFDVLSGIVKAFCLGEYKSSILRQGIWRKISLLILYIVSCIFDRSVVYLGYGGELLHIPIAGLLVFMETTSVVENVAKINPDIVPDTILNMMGMKKK